MRRTPAIVAVVAGLLLPAAALGRDVRPGDVTAPGGFQVEVAAIGLAAPTMVAFDDQGRMLIAESGYDESGTPRVSRIETDGTRTVLAEIPADQRPLTAVAFHQGVTYVVTADRVSRLEASGALVPLITGLPGLGDHQANQLVVDDEHLYLAVGTMTNSGVVGPDNAVFGWLEEPSRQQLRDVPCEDVTLSDAQFRSEDPVGGRGEVTTSAYSSFGTAHAAGTVIPGDPKCNGAVLRANLDGAGLEVVAWGFRNPYGLERGPDGELYVAMHGFDARGTRPVENAWDCFYRVQPGAWYGWPDFACDVPVTDARFRPPGGPQPGFVLASHPSDSPPAPIARFDPHAAINGFAFSPGEPWGPPTDAFVALFGDFTPATGTVDRPRGVRVVRLDTTNGSMEDFLSNPVPGEASKHGLGGLEHPSDVTFGPDGAMYVADWGVARISTDGLKLERDSGVIWRVTAQASATAPAAPLGVILNLVVIAALAGVTLLLGAGRSRLLSLPAAALGGVVAGLGMGAFMMLVASPLLSLPWYAAPRVLATMVMGRAAVADILAFDLLSFLVGLVVLLVLGALLGLAFGFLLRRPGILALAAGLAYGLATWALLQFVVLPVAFPLVSDKGFPPAWYAISFGLYGLLLGAVAFFIGGRRARSGR